ncbi:MAG: TIGR03936 family radical SAM-associated protein [Syntrophaceticus sp.]
MPRYRLEYAKIDRARFLSHRELMTTLQRALRRASFPLTYTRGYNPRPKFSFGPPLGVGVAGLKEYMDLELDDDIKTFEDYLEALNCQLPPGIRAHRLALVPPGDAGLGKLINCARYLVEVPLDDYKTDSDQLFHHIKGEEAWYYERPSDGKVFNVSAAIIKSDIDYEEGRVLLCFLMKVGQGEVPVPGLLDYIGKSGITPLQLSQVTRTGLYRIEKRCLINPLGEREEFN